MLWDLSYRYSKAFLLPLQTPPPLERCRRIIGMRSARLSPGPAERGRGVTRERFLRLCLAAMAGLSLLSLAGCGGSQDGSEDGKDNEDNGGGGGGGGY